jgi:CRP-like cAMP-binding protein
VDTPQQSNPLKRAASPPAIVSPNLLLASLSPAEYERVRPLLTATPLSARQRLQRKGEPVEVVYFPWGGVCSVVATLSDGGMVELATVGREGVVGYLTAFGQQAAAHDAMVQIPVPNGGAHVMSARDFRAEMAIAGGLRSAVNAYMIAAHVFISTSVACNALHGAEERCARWLLMAHDRVDGDEFQISHEFIAMMLGVRRPTATVVAGVLQGAGLIRYRRGQMRILDREGLENAACECYREVSAHFTQLRGRRVPRN